MKITELEWESGFNPIGGSALVNRVNVTVQNTGANNASGLTLAVRLVYNGTEFNKGFTEQIGTLHAGESLGIPDWIGSVVGNRPNGTECVSTLMCGKVVLDERTKVIKWD